MVAENGKFYLYPAAGELVGALDGRSLFRGRRWARAGTRFQKFRGWWHMIG